MIISDLSAASCQISTTDRLVKAELHKPDIEFSSRSPSVCHSSSYSTENTEVGTNMTVENSSSPTSGDNYDAMAVFRSETLIVNGSRNFNPYSGSYMDYEGLNDDSSEPPELQNGALDGNEVSAKVNEVQFLSLNDTTVSGALEAALLNCTTGDASTSCVLPTPKPPHIITCTEMNALDINKLNSSKSIVLSHNRGNSNMKREWRNVGWFTSEEEMDRVRKSQRVSKWKTVEQINGLKVFFRCNKWKRTNCNYRMYVMYYAMDKISLNESGVHDHSTLNPEYKPRPHVKSPCKLRKWINITFVCFFCSL